MYRCVCLLLSYTRGCDKLNPCITASEMADAWKDYGGHTENTTGAHREMKRTFFFTSPGEPTNAMKKRGALLE